jgi:hypothetical protein
VSDAEKLVQQARVAQDLEQIRGALHLVDHGQPFPVFKGKHRRCYLMHLENRKRAFRFSRSLQIREVGAIRRFD